MIDRHQDAIAAAHTDHHYGATPYERIDASEDAFG